MKKIWPLLLLLLLLIIFCVWTKLDKMHITSSSSKTATHKTAITPVKHYINYEISQHENNYVLHGNFTNIEQQNKLKDTASAASANFKIENTSTNQSLLGEDAITLTKTILPHFIQHYKNGKIVYSNEALRIYGDVDSYEAQHEMQRLLTSSTIASQDNSTVHIEKKPLHFSITKNENNIVFKGIFNDAKQAKPISNLLPSNAKVVLSKGKHLVDNGAIKTTKNILSDFISTYKQGSIEYKNETLTVSGTVATKEELSKMHTLLASSNMHLVDKTTVDPEALARVRAEEMAKQKAQEEAKRKSEEINAARLAQEAKAKRLAQEEANKKAKEAENKRLAQEKADKKAKALQDAKNAKLIEAKRAKENIINLLKMQNIEFEVAKGSLTPRGKGTVDKLASILKQYPHINIEIAGHTDSDGSAAFNQKLSQSRVDTVQKRLISKGINANRLTAKGYGESRPLVPNTSNANKQKNRRVEINIQGE